MTFAMTEIEVPEPERHWIMCDNHEWDQPLRIVANIHYEPDFVIQCKHCGMTASKRHIGSRQRNIELPPGL